MVNNIKGAKHEGCGGLSRETKNESKVTQKLRERRTEWEMAVNS